MRRAAPKSFKMWSELVLVHPLLLAYYEISTEIENKYLEYFIATWPSCDIQLCDNFLAQPIFFLKIEFYRKNQSMRDWKTKTKQNWSFGRDGWRSTALEDTLHVCGGSKCVHKHCDWKLQPRTMDGEQGGQRGERNPKNWGVRFRFVLSAHMSNDKNN